MSTYYNGYNFTYTKDEPVYNPTLALYFLKKFNEDSNYPRKMMDSNISANKAKLHYIYALPQGKDLIIDIVKDNKKIEILDLEDRLEINKMLSPESKDFSFMSSFLYYFGLLTFCGQTPSGKLKLKVPNLVIQKFYIERNFNYCFYICYVFQGFLGKELL